jgi:hypothetical protein
MLTADADPAQLCWITALRARLNEVIVVRMRPARGSHDLPATWRCRRVAV